MGGSDVAATVGVTERRQGQRRHADRRAASRVERRMFYLLWGIGFLNYTDAAQTIYLLNVKLMVEANRFMAFLLDHSPYVFWMYKTLVPTIGCVLLWRFRKKVKWLPGAVITVFAVYLTVVIRSFLYMVLPGHPAV
jgi:Domain of unknown function (DUF5658)